MRQPGALRTRVKRQVSPSRDLLRLDLSWKCERYCAGKALPTPPGEPIASVDDDDDDGRNSLHDDPARVVFRIDIVLARAKQHPDDGLVPVSADERQSCQADASKAGSGGWLMALRLRSLWSLWQTHSGGKNGACLAEQWECLDGPWKVGRPGPRRNLMLGDHKRYTAKLHVILSGHLDFPST
ncbi:hypothetical protein N658DRAFT_315445 [Parathielavia hyrcaniae]|uniref:Uncharacterized protein n=1 Tax=Parathielavia hyrcaniae TaxID=113614 RepID=A0AAN6PWX7_9PEZI|nr:hypothetical protein N658DRAFT_315445 [Parathielavia hyrcaniae]